MWGVEKKPEVDLYKDMVARRFTFIRFMFEGVQPWTEMVAYFIEKNGIKLGNMKVEANWCNVINSNRVSNVQGL